MNLVSLRSRIKKGHRAFGEPDNPKSYMRLVLWLGYLGLGYGLALTYLAKVLDVERDYNSQVLELAERGTSVLDPT